MKWITALKINLKKNYQPKLIKYDEYLFLTNKEKNMQKIIESKNITSQKGIYFTNLGLLILISVALILKLHLIFMLKIGWDEFLFLSKVHSCIRGSLTGQFQTFYVHFFTWLPYISDNEVSQVIAARLVLYLFFLWSCVYIYLIGKQFLNRSGALFGVLCYLSLSNIIIHATSFRADSICSFLFLFSIYHIIARPRPKFSIALSSLAMAISLMVSIKALFHLLTIVAIFICLFIFAKNKKNISRQIAFFSFTFFCIFLLLYNFHSSTLFVAQANEANSVASNISAKNFISNASEKVIILNDFFPRLPYFIFDLYKNMLTWVLLVLGIFIVLWESIRSKKQLISKNLLLPFAFLIPLLTLLFYRNAFPYYYVFIMAPAIIFCGAIIHKITEDFKKKNSAVFLIIATVFIIPVFIGFLFHYGKNSSKEITAQKELIRIVHKIFPEPVPYIDGCSAISSFPKKGFFMSTWGMENYLKANKPIMHDILTHHQPLFILVNIPSLDFSLPRENKFTDRNYGLLKEDWDILKSNFIHHWGLISVAGKEFKFDYKASPRDFEILIPGIYTFEGNGTISIDEVPYEAGSIINLKKGHHIINPYSTTQVILRWGNNLHRPLNEPSFIPAFYGF